jgi:serine/threonine protein kinase
MDIPTVIKDRYQVKEILGKGGMGVVYKAFDTVLKRDVAIKTLLDISDPGVLELFHREYEVLAHINHPNIIEIMDIGEIGESDPEGSPKPYFIMPLLPGVPLDRLIKTSSHRLTVERVVDIISQTCRGLHAAHEKGLVHRDVKPSNIVVMDDDSVKIIDFGVAHVADAKSRTGVKGTLLYMAPEQLQMKPASPQSDIFSLGVVAYESLTRRRPFEGPSERDVFDAILHLIPPPASDLNPTVSQTVSRVIHKAMAKQQYHRFATARDFAETLQKALRNEPIEIFDPARTQPRIQRVKKAFEQADYQFASEILGELEAEGYIDQEMSLLRLKIDQGLRQKRIQQLLESARTRLEEREFPLALQKVQEALELDPTNAGALSLKSTIEEQRSEGMIGDWLRLARQHLEHHDYNHAREALKNVLQIKPKDSRAGQLLTKVDAQEQEHQRIYQEKQALYQAAAEAWSRGDVSAALSRLEHVLDLDRRAPDLASPDTSASYQSFYNQVRQEHEAINSAYTEARKHLAGGEFAKALALCEQYLGKYPEHALFKALKFDIEEKQRQELSTRIAEIDRQVEAEPNLDKRVEILKEALELFPHEPHFEQSLRLIREKRDLVNAIVAKSRLHEERGQFSDALAQWEILRTIYSQYPGLSFEIERLEKRREQQARAEAKARWVRQVDQQMSAGDYTRALDLLHQAEAEFPDEAELAEMEKLVKQALERVNEALALMAQGQDLVSQGHFEEGLEALRKAHRQDEANPVIRGLLLDTLVERARVLVDQDWRAAEPLLAEALDLDPGHALAKSLQTLAQDRKRGEFVEKCLAQARRAQASGDLNAALTQVQEALTSYGTDPRLAQLRATLTKEVQEAERRQARRRDLDDLRKLEKEAEAASNLASLAPIAGRIQAISTLYRDDAEFQSAITNIQPRVAAMMEAIEKAPPKVGAVPQSAQRATPVPGAASVQSPGQASPPGVPVSPGRAVPAGKPVPGTAPPAPAKPFPSKVPPGLATAAMGPGIAPAGAPAVPQPPVVTEPEEERARKKPRVWIFAGIAALLIVAAGVFLYPRLIHRPIAATLTAKPGTVEKGQSTTLSWTSKNATETSLEPGVGKVGPQGSTTVAPQQSTTYTLTATGPRETKTATVLVTVTGITPVAQGLRIYTDLEAGKILLDGKAQGQLEGGQFSLDDIGLGKHSLEISAGRSQAQIDFEVTPGSLLQVIGPVRTRELKAVLVSNMAGEARIDSSYGPEEASLDGRPVGEVGSTPLELKGLEAGTHELVLGKGKDARKLAVEFGPAPVLTAHLSAERNVGTLLITTGEDDVTVLLNDRKYPRTTRHGQLLIANLEPKSYKVDVFKEGFQKVDQQQAQIEKGQEAKLVFSLKPVPTVASLVIRGAPSAARVLLDGNLLGAVQPDGSFTANVTPGDHTLEMQEEGYKPVKMARHFGPGEPVPLNVKMDVEEARPKPPSPPRLAKLIIQTTPNAQVSIDGQPAGQANSDGRLELDQLPAGEHSLQVSLKGYQDYKQAVTLNAGGSATLPVALTVTIPVAHKHVMGECSGTLLVGGGRIQYLTTNKSDAFDVPSSSVTATGSADFGKHFYIDIKGARRYVFRSGAPMDDLKRIQSVLALH